MITVIHCFHALLLQALAAQQEEAELRESMHHQLAQNNFAKIADIAEAKDRHIAEVRAFCSALRFPVLPFGC